MADSGDRGGGARYSVRLAVLLTLGVGVLSVATGVADISAGGSFGPLDHLIPPAVQQTAGFTGALTGFLMLASALGLRRGLRLAWRATLLLLPVTALQGLVQASPFSLPLVALSVAAVPVVWLTRHRFDRRLSLSMTELATAAALAGTVVYGTAGAWALREDFTGIETPLDAVYYVTVTASTVGYGDVTPAPSSPGARLFGISVVVLGTASFGLALSALLGPAIQARFAAALGRMTQSELDLLEDHVVVLGYGDLTEPFVEELGPDTDFVVVTPDADRAAALRERDLQVYVGDPSDETTLGAVHAERARAVVVATESDAEDALSVLTARAITPDAHVVAAATERENVEKLRRAGADTVVSPAVIGARLLAESALGGRGAEATADALGGDTEP